MRIRHREFSLVKRPTHTFKRRAQVGGPITVSTGYYPEAIVSRESIQDESHSNCYPYCGGPFMLHRMKTDIAFVSCKNGYEYTAPYLVALTEGCAVRPVLSFTGLEDVKDSLTSNTLHSATRPIDISMPPELNAIAQDIFERARPRLAKLNLTASFVELGETRRMLQLRASKIQDSWKRLTNRDKKLFNASTPTKYTPADVRRVYEKRQSQLSKIERSRKSYLEAQFGWIPFVNDLVSFSDVVINSESYINKLAKLNGQWHRRRIGPYSIDRRENIQSFGPGNSTYYLIPGAYSIKERTVKTSLTDEIMYSGMFKYYIPGIRRDTFVGRATALSVLTGLHLNPRNVYDAIPWSWLVSWNTAADRMVEHYTATRSEECCNKYGYLTRHRKMTSAHTVAFTGSYRTPTGSAKPSISSYSGTSSITYEHKTRHPSTSKFFGFTTSEPPLTERQALILTCLL